MSEVSWFWFFADMEWNLSEAQEAAEERIPATRQIGQERREGTNRQETHFIVN